MKSYVVSYDLNNQKDYSKLIKTIEDYPNSAKSISLFGSLTQNAVPSPFEMN